MTKNQSTTNPEENQIVTKDHFSTIREQLRTLKEENEKQVFDYESTKGEKEVRSYIAAMRTSKTAIASVHKSAKAEAKAIGDKLDADKRELTAEVQEMIDFHNKPLLEKKDRIEKEAAAAEKLEKQRHRLIEAHEMNDLFNRERSVRIAEEKIAAEKEAAEKIKEDARKEKERIENEEKIKKEAAAKAKLEAEAEAKKEKDAVEQEKKDAIAAKEKAEKDAEDARIKAEVDKELAEEKRLSEIEAAKKKAAKETQDAIDKVKKDQAIKEAAAKKESDRLAKIEDDRISDVNYRTMINNKILNSLKKIGLSDDDALKTAKALINGQIIAVSVNY